MSERPAPRVLTLYPHVLVLDFLPLVYRCECGRDLTEEWLVRNGILA